MKSRLWVCGMAMVLAAVLAAGAGADDKHIPLYRGKPGAKIGDICINPKDGAAMVWVPAWEFLMGSADKDVAAFVKEHPKLDASDLDAEKPQHKVYLSGYWVYKCEVTVKQYRTFCNETGREMPDPPSGGWKDDHPIVNVTWNDASDYAKWAGASLPTEAQWEKAARGVDGRAYPWGSKWDASKCTKNTPQRQFETEPVASHPSGASPYGCLDMVGNVFQWCKDLYQEKYYSQTPSGGWVDPQGPVTGDYRVVRGGGWYGADLNRCAYRFDLQPLNFSSYLGFRSVR